MKKLIAIFALALICAPSAFAETSKTPIKGEFGNHCAMGLTLGKQVETDCAINWTDSTSGKIYCFSSEAFKTEWAKNTTANTTKAAAAYAKLGTTAPAANTTH